MGVNVVDGKDDALTGTFSDATEVLVARFLRDRFSLMFLRKASIRYGKVSTHNSMLKDDTLTEPTFSSL